MAIRNKPLSFQTYMAFIIRHPAWPLLIAAVITLWLAWQLPHLSFKTTVYDLIIDELDQARSYRDFTSLFGSDEIIRIVVKADNIFEPATFAKVKQLSQSAGQIDGVRRVLSLPEVKKQVDPRNEWKTDRFAGILATVTLFDRNLISTDHKTTIITLVLATLSDKADVITAVRQLIDNSGKDLALYQDGIPLVSQALAQYTRQDFLHLTPITLGVIALLLLLLFRNLHALVMPLICVLLATTWTFGYMALAGVAVSMLTIIVPVFLIAVGTAYCLHICSEYLAQARTAPSVRVACEKTFSQMAFPVALAVLTTMLGIGSLAANRIEAIQEFATFTCIGMASLMAIVLTVLPAMLSILPLPKCKKRAASGLDLWIERLLHRIVNLNLHHQKTCLTLLAIVISICIVGLFLIRSETNPVAFLKSNTPVSRNFHDIYQQMSGSFPINVAMSGPSEDYFEDPSNIAELARLQTYLNMLPGVDKTISIADYLKLVNYTYNRFDPADYVLPEDPYEMRMLINNFKILLGNDMLQRFMTSDFRQANILLLTHISSSRQFLTTRQKILDHVKVDLDQELSWDVTGLGMVIAASSHLLTMGQVKSLSISLVLIFAVMVTLFLSAKVGLIAVVPNLFPIVVNFGIMGLFGIPLSVATSLIASVAIGLAVDDTIHYLVRYNREFKKDLDKDRAMRASIMAVGRPIIFTTVTIGIGFSILLFSHFQPTATFGLLMVTTMICALVGDLILLPTLMMHVELVTAWDLLKMMPAVGTISPGMVHELNQPLNAIKVGSNVIEMMLKKDKSPNSKQLATVTQEIGQQVDRASQIIERFSEAGSLPGFEKKPLEINAPIRNTLALLGHQLKLDSIEVVVRSSTSLPQVMAHHNRLVQVYCNLLTNAQEAINARRAQGGLGEHRQITIRSYEDKGRVRVSIEDSGIGIPEHNLDRIFEPFFTTKEKGQGKGLGLTICKQIIRDCGGRIRVSGSTKEGATVILSFPALAAG